MGRRVGDAEAQRDLIDEQRLGQPQAQRPEVVAGGKHDLVAATLQRGALQQGLVAAPVVVGDGAQEFATAAVQAEYRHRDAGARPAVGDEPFAVILADDLVDSPSGAVAELVGHYQTVGASVLGVERVDPRDTGSYGIVEVVPAELMPVTVHARLWLFPDAPLETLAAIQAVSASTLAAFAGLGWDLTRSWIVGQLQRAGVHKVELLSPTTDIRVAANQAVRLASLNLEFAGRDR